MIIIAGQNFFGNRWVPWGNIGYIIIIFFLLQNSIFIQSAFEIPRATQSTLACILYVMD